MSALLSGFQNARDLGGLPLIAGGTTRTKAVVRAESPWPVPAVSPDDFVRVIDLRSEDEARARPHPFSAHPGYMLSPLIDPRAEAVRDSAAEQTLGTVYCGSIERNTRTIAAIMVNVADSLPGTVLISCSAGKDRTGIISALLLRLAGAEEAAIRRDYQLSEFRLRELFERDLIGVADPVRRARIQRFHNADPDNIMQMLDHVERTYGSVAGYPEAIGVSGARIGRLRDRLSGTAP